MPEDTSYYERIYAVVRQIPYGRVATYGQIAEVVGGVTARMVGYAMAGLKEGSGVPWQRVINSQGKISPHGAGFGSAVQRARLEEEGLVFDAQGRLDLAEVGWLGSTASHKRAVRRVPQPPPARGLGVVINIVSAYRKRFRPCENIRSIGSRNHAHGHEGLNYKTA